MSQPPYPSDPQQPYSGQPGSGAPQGYPPPGSYPPPGQGSYPPPGAYPQPGAPQPGSYPPPGQGPQQPGSYPPPGQGAPQPGSYPPPPPPGPGGYAQPGQDAFGAPQYGTPQYPPPPQKKSSALKIVLIVVAVVSVLCLGGVAVAFFAAKDTVEDVVDAARITVVEPETLSGRAKVTDPTVAGSVAGLDAELSKVPGATSSVGAVYGDVQAQDLVMIAAASSVTGSPQERFDEFTTGMNSGALKVDNLTDTDPGPLGGIAKCGETTTSGVPMALCVWSDNGSIGMIAMLFKDKAALEKEFVSMRGQIEKKS
jgi:hypothetical protein